MGNTGRRLEGMSYAITLTGRDISCITQAFEAISGSASGDLVPNADQCGRSRNYVSVSPSELGNCMIADNQMTAKDSEWRETAISICERFDAALPPQRQGDLIWLTAELCDLIIRGGQAPEQTAPQQR